MNSTMTGRTGENTRLLETEERPETGHVASPVVPSHAAAKAQGDRLGVAEEPAALAGQSRRRGPRRVPDLRVSVEVDRGASAGAWGDVVGVSAAVWAAAGGCAGIHAELVVWRSQLVVDMTFGQDACRIRTGHATENFAAVRHFALNLIRNYKADRYSVPRRRQLCDYNRDYRGRVLQAAAEA